MRSVPDLTNKNVLTQRIPVRPESFLRLSVRDVHDLAYARHDVRLAGYKLVHFTNLVAFRQGEDVLDSGCCRDFFIEPDKQGLERQESFVADGRLQTLQCANIEYCHRHGNPGSRRSSCRIPVIA